MDDCYCLSIGLVQQAIDEMKSHNYPPQFHLLFEICRAAHGNVKTHVPISIASDIGPWLEIPGGPKGKPYFFIFCGRNNRGIKGMWRAKNIAGSWTESSLRSNYQNLLTGEKSGGNSVYKLPDDPGAFVNQKIAGYGRIPAWAVAVYYFRNACFNFESAPISLLTLVHAFQEIFSLSCVWNAFDESIPQNLAGESAFTREKSSPSSKPDFDSPVDGVDIKIWFQQRRLDANECMPSKILPDAKDSEIEKAAINLLNANVFGGIVFIGPPGTSKSWSAERIAQDVTGNDPSRQFYVQFHPSYQYDDFMEGYAPDSEHGGFMRREGVFLQAVRKAGENPDADVALVIDELSRADVGRVFGEALTYLEPSKRGQEFLLPSGITMSVPENLKVIATMNSLDRGVSDIDEAFGRRLAFIVVNPDADKIPLIVDENCGPVVISRLQSWLQFDLEIAKKSPRAALGHAFFSGIRNESDARMRWNYQIHRYLSHALGASGANQLSQLEDKWAALFPDAETSVNDGQSQ